MLKQIPNFDNYSINDYGDVVNTKFNRSVNPHVTKQGYLATELWKNNKRYQFQVHRLVAITFIPELDQSKVVNHKDGDRRNNHISNLEWITIAENNRHGKIRRKGERMNKEKIMKVYKSRDWNSVEDFLIELMRQ